MTNNNLLELKKLTENKTALSAIINNYTYEIFEKYKGEKVSDELKLLYKNIKITDIDDNYGYAYDISLEYKGEKFELHVDNEGNLYHCK